MTDQLDYPKSISQKTAELATAELQEVLKNNEIPEKMRKIKDTSGQERQDHSPFGYAFRLSKTWEEGYKPLAETLNNLVLPLKTTEGGYPLCVKMGYFGGGHIKEYHEYAMNNAIKLTTEGFGQYILPGVMIQPFEHFMAVESWTVDEGVHPTYEHDNYDSLLTLDVSLKGKVKWVGLNNLETNERNWRSEQHISEVYSRLVTFLKNNSARIIRSHNGDTIEEAVERVIHVPADSKDKRIYFLDLDHIGFNSIEKR